MQDENNISGNENSSLHDTFRQLTLDKSYSSETQDIVIVINTIKIFYIIFKECHSLVFQTISVRSVFINTSGSKLTNVNKTMQRALQNRTHIQK